MASNKSTRKAADKASRRSASKVTRKKRQRRRRRLTDKIRAALGRRDVTEQPGNLYQARVEEELGRGRRRRMRDTHAEPRQARRSR